MEIFIIPKSSSETNLTDIDSETKAQISAKADNTYDNTVVLIDQILGETVTHKQDLSAQLALAGSVRLEKVKNYWKKKYWRQPKKFTYKNRQ